MASLQKQNFIIYYITANIIQVVFSVKQQPPGLRNEANTEIPKTVVTGWLQKPGSPQTLMLKSPIHSIKAVFTPRHTQTSSLVSMNSRGWL